MKRVVVVQDDGLDSLSRNRSRRLNLLDRKLANIGAASLTTLSLLLLRLSFVIPNRVPPNNYYASGKQILRPSGKSRVRKICVITRRVCSGGSDVTAEFSR